MITTSKTRSLRVPLRNAIVITLDTAAAAVSLPLALYLRVGTRATDAMLDGLASSILLFVAIATILFALLGLHRRVWRYASLADGIAIVEVATLAVAAFLFTQLLLDRGGWMPRSLPIIQWLVLVVMLGGMRIGRRLISEYHRRLAPLGSAAAPARSLRPALLAGPSERVELVLRLIEGHAAAAFKPVGILDDAGRHMRLTVRGVPVLGSIDILEHAVEQLEANGQRPQCLIMTEAAEDLHGPTIVRMVAKAESLGLKVAWLPKLTDLDGAAAGGLDLRFINIAELLGRPQARLDSGVVARAIVGRRVLVTGAGGTIGRELVRQIATFDPAQLILLDACEFNLYDVDLELRENHPAIARTPVLCSIRQRRQLMQVFADHRPDLVFHAAALKHVHLVEQHPCAGVQTNVLGTRNVADAARRYGVRAMVQVSTDKAVNPVGMMGATKRLGELYCQALDLDGINDDSAPRFLTVRFGNVLGSSGSLIPLFQRQLSRGMPLTVTHPDIQRYFMTVHEAVQLILQSTARGLEGDIRRGRIFVLDMGEPVKIMDIARRMIRLAGLEPDRDGMIDIVGLRPGEKLYEELFDTEEHQLPSVVEGLFEAEPLAVPLETLRRGFDALNLACRQNDAERVTVVVRRLLRLGHSDAPADRPFILAPAAETKGSDSPAAAGNRGVSLNA